MAPCLDSQVSIWHMRPFLQTSWLGLKNVNLGNQQQIFEAITAKCKDFSVNNYWCMCASVCIVL